MKTLNGKLVNQEAEVRQFEEVIYKTEEIARRCEYLESQITAISKQDNTEYLHKLEQKIGFLEDTTSRQANQFLWFKISAIAFVSLWFIFGINNQPKYDENQPENKPQSMELILQDIKIGFPRYLNHHQVKNQAK
jgi:hypothetical protein